MMGWEQLLQWEYLIFALPFIGALFYIFMMATGIAAMDGDHDFAFEHDIDHDVDIGHDIDHDFDHDHDVGTEEYGFLIRALSVLGVGRVPLSIIIMTFSLLWGFFGMASNLLLSKVLIFPLAFIWVSLTTAFVLTVMFTRWVSMSLAKIMPATETSTFNRSDLIGTGAEVRYKVNQKSGTITLYDKFRNLQQYDCRAMPGEEDIPPGVKVVIIEYHSEEGYFVVKRNELLNQ